MALVIDVSAVVSLALSDEDAAFGERVLHVVSEHGAWAPAIFWFELRNVLVVAERKKRLSTAATTAFLHDVGLLAIRVDPAPEEASTLHLARKHQLSVYDASYLELAIRKALPLATLDVPLRTAAMKEDIGIFGS